MFKEAVAVHQRASAASGGAVGVLDKTIVHFAANYAQIITWLGDDTVAWNLFGTAADIESAWCGVRQHGAEWHQFLNMTAYVVIPHGEQVSAAGWTSQERHYVHLTHDREANIGALATQIIAPIVRCNNSRTKPVSAEPLEPNPLVAQAIEDFNQGRLYVHLFEAGGIAHPALFMALNGDPVPFDTNWRNGVIGDEALGFKGIATTVAKRGKAVTLWNDFNDLGIMFSGSSPYFHPFWMSPNDAYSHVRGSDLVIERSPNPIELLQAPQAEHQFDLTENIQERKRLAQQAAQMFFDSVEDPAAWAAYIQMQEQLKSSNPTYENMVVGCNETVAIAHLKAACGIVIYRTVPAINQEQLMLAALLQQKLREKFPETLPCGLPIFCYDPHNLEQQLTVIPQTTIQKLLMEHTSFMGR